MSTLMMAVITFLLHVLTLKLAASTMGVPRKDNRYFKALSIVVLLSVLGFVAGFIPFFGWLVYAALWVAVVMSAYRLSFPKSIGVAIMQVGLKIALWALLKLFGFSTLLADQLTMGF